jgi:hypothetical protein
MPNIHNDNISTIPSKTPYNNLKEVKFFIKPTHNNTSKLPDSEEEIKPHQHTWELGLTQTEKNPTASPPHFIHQKIKTQNTQKVIPP